MEEFITACPRNCYSTCTFRVQVENNVIIRILPYEGNLATPEGPCIKGLSSYERTISPDRIMYPLIRSSSGKFSRIPTHEAYDMICDKLLSIKKEYGSHSLLWFRGSGMSGLTNECGSAFWEAFGGTTTTYGNLCWPAGLEAVRLTMGSVKHNVPWDLENAKTIIIWGKNSAETNIQEIAYIGRAKEKGCRVIVIDLVRTATADKADTLYVPKPGSDAALALAIADVLIKEDLIDHEFISKYVHGFAEFLNSPRITPSQAQVITGIPSEEIRRLAITIGTIKPLTILPGYGLQRHKNGGQTIRSILLLSVITGNIGKSGAGFNYANLQSYVYDSVKEPLSYYPDALSDKPFRRTISMAKLGRDMLSTIDPPLVAMWVERGNPVLQSPETVSVIKAINNLKFKVVIEQFMTDTAEYADIILPAKDMFEQSDIVSSYWSPYIQFKPAVLEPPGEVVPESEIYYNLAKRMGIIISTELIPEPGNENTENWLAKRICRYPEVTIDSLRKSPVIAPGLEQIAYEDMKFETPSGRIELYSTEAKERWGVSPLPGYSDGNSGNENIEFPLTFISSNIGSRIHSQFGNLKIIQDTIHGAFIKMSPADADTRDIKTGQKIRVFNNTGDMTGTAEVSGRIPRGVIVFPNGIWLSENGGANKLIAASETDMGYGSAFHDNNVEVEIA